MWFFYHRCCCVMEYNWAVQILLTHTSNYVKDTIQKPKLNKIRKMHMQIIF